jgi:hypothetical protein
MACAAPEAFIAWILDLDGTPALLLDSVEGRLLACSPALAALGADSERWAAELAIVGEEGSTALALSLGSTGDCLHPWLRLPLEAGGPGAQLLLLLALSAEPQPLALAARLRAAQDARDSRHSLNQPLTAITFLVENLYFACLEGGADAAYRARKRAQMLGELQRLRALLRQYEVLDTEAR